MARIANVFLDDGGVLNDNALRAPQWQKLVGDFFAPRLGGDPTAWAAANVSVFPGLFEKYQAMRSGQDNFDAIEADRLYHIDWLRSMAEIAGVESPSTDDECFDLAWKATNFVLPRLVTSYPGAGEAARSLSKDYALWTASGGYSYELKVYLSNMGIDGLIQAFYGVDLVRIGKSSAEFYRRIFADAGVDPATSLVVDDSPNCLRRARELGARTALVSPPIAGASEFDLVIASLAELPPRMGELE